MDRLEDLYDLSETQHILGAINPIYETIKPSEPGAKHAVCAYFRNDAWHVDLFLFDFMNPIEPQLEKVRNAGSGTLFNDLIFILWLGEIGILGMRQNFLEAYQAIWASEVKRAQAFRDHPALYGPPDEHPSSNG